MPPISSSILSTYQPGEFILQCPICLPFHTVYGVLKARMLKWLSLIMHVQFSCFKQNTHTHTTQSDRLFKYPNYFLCTVIICLHLSLPFPVIILVEGILIQTICFTSTNWVFHLDVTNSKMFALFFAMCSPKNNKYPLSTSYIINIQLLKLHSINLFCDLRQETKLWFFHTVN